MMQNILHWLVSAVAIGLAALLIPAVEITWVGALLVAIVLGLLSTFIKPILVALTLPLNIVTLGLFSLVINAVLVLVADFIVPGFSVDGFWWALVYAAVLSLINVFFGLRLFKK